MKILMLHNRYRDLGGEDASTDFECALLKSHGNDVHLMTLHNPEVQPSSLSILKAGVAAPWSVGSYLAVRDVIRKFHPSVVHVQNFWMRLSPSVHFAAEHEGIPSVQSLRNFRLICANALLFRNGAQCEDCIKTWPWRGVVRRCYRSSAVASLAVVSMIGINRLLRTWNRHVGAYIANSTFARDKYVEAGLPEGRIFVKPNSVADPGRSATPANSTKIVYAGRLSKEKGVAILLNAWAQRRLGRFGQLQIVGDGPERENLEHLCADLHLTPAEVTFTGLLPQARMRLADARAVVMPSQVYETFGRVAMEAAAAGVPCIASDLGALKEVVRHESTGLLFRHDDVQQLGLALERMLTNNELVTSLGREARKYYLSTYSPECNYATLMRIYGSVIMRRPEGVPTTQGGCDQKEISSLC